MAVRLEGHTDNTGDAAANKKLSLDRAVAVKEIMVKEESPRRVSAPTAMEEEKPIAPNETEEGRAKNRRTELVVDEEVRRCGGAAKKANDSMCILRSENLY